MLKTLEKCILDKISYASVDEKKSRQQLFSCVKFITCNKI